MVNIVLASLLVAFWVQTSPPIRLGPTSDQLTGEDLDQVVAIARQEGGRTRLILGRSLSGVARPSIPWEVWVFLEPPPTGVRYAEACFYGSSRTFLALGRSHHP